MSENPPPYTDGQTSDPPRYTLPETFVIGRRCVSLLVRPQQLRGHLSVLHAFDVLRTRVERDNVARLSGDVRAMEPEKRWGWFVNVAVERFHRWCHCLAQGYSTDVALALPPIDVLMVWHAYLLNPIWYAEDSARVPELVGLSALTEYLSAHVGSPDVLITTLPHPDRVRSWVHGTGTPYDPLDAAAAVTHREFQCPHCDRPTIAGFIGPFGSGYSQNGFQVGCTSCGKTITRDLLGLYKFAKDIANATGFLPGTLHTPYERNDTNRATLIKKRVMTSAGLLTSGTLGVQEVMTRLNYDPVSLTRILLQSQIQPRIGRRILGAYSDDRPFSVELVGAVLRQASFVRKMADLGWTRPDFFADEDEMIVLQHCVARYHAFLGLMADTPGSFFVPTLDIDLAWHTHQLTASLYHTQCQQVVGRFIDHDDKVDEDHLATGFDVTCRAWSDRYGLPYTYCGCPLPGRTLGQRLRHALALHRRRAHDEQNILRPPPEAAAGTHASDHNSVCSLHDRKALERARERRRKKAERRRQRQEALDAKQKRDVGYGRSMRACAPAHELAFFYPVPLWIGDASCVNVPFVVGNGACATGGVGGCSVTCGAGAICTNRTQCGGAGGAGAGAGCGGGGVNCGGGGNNCGGGGGGCGGGSGGGGGGGGGCGGC